MIGSHLEVNATAAVFWHGPGLAVAFFEWAVMPHPGHHTITLGSPLVHWAAYMAEHDIAIELLTQQRQQGLDHLWAVFGIGVMQQQQQQQQQHNP